MFVCFSQYKEEERLIHLLFQCNSNSKQFISLRTPGSKIPPETFSFLKKLLHGMCNQLITESSEVEVKEKGILSLDYASSFHTL